MESESKCDCSMENPHREAFNPVPGSTHWLATSTIEMRWYPERIVAESHDAEKHQEQP